MGGYASVNGPCRQSRKSIKAEIKKTKSRLTAFVELSNGMDIPYEARMQSVGALYLRITDLKNELKQTS